MHACASTSGFAAGKRFAPALASRENSAADFAEALMLVDPHLERLLLEAQRAIDAHWRAVEAIAHALLERERLEAMELYKLIVAAR